MWALDYVLSYDMIDFEKHSWVRSDPAMRQESHREDEYFGRFLAHWKPDDRLAISVGLEASFEEFGSKSPGFPHQPPQSSRYRSASNMPRWSTQTWSPLFESQWQISEKWTNFIGVRLDKNSYSHWLFSPRLALIHATTKKDTLKFMLTRSNRLNVAQELRLSHDTGSGNADSETLDNIELRYERQHSSRLYGALSLYYQQLDAIAYDSRADRTFSVGQQEQAGIELELSYQGDRLQLGLSHQYTKLIEFGLRADS